MLLLLWKRQVKVSQEILFFFFLTIISGLGQIMLQCSECKQWFHTGFFFNVGYIKLSFFLKKKNVWKKNRLHFLFQGIDSIIFSVQFVIKNLLIPLLLLVKVGKSIGHLKWILSRLCIYFFFFQIEGLMSFE